MQANNLVQRDAKHSNMLSVNHIAFGINHFRRQRKSSGHVQTDSNLAFLHYERKEYNINLASSPIRLLLTYTPPREHTHTLYQ